MDIVIVIDANDPVSTQVCDCMLEGNIFAKASMTFKDAPVYSYRNAYMITNNQRSAEAEQVDEDIRSLLSIKPELTIFPTVHRSRSGIPSLTAHTQGNWAIAEMGGLNKRLGISAENFLKEALQTMAQKQPNYPSLDGFDVIQEATHHGPYVSCPSMFIEVGSTEKEWHNKEAVHLLAETITYLIENSNSIADQQYETAVGIGGPHANRNFRKIILNDEQIAISHICPKYMLENLDLGMLTHAMERSTQPASKVILDWKGIGPEKQRIVELLEENN
ncbi:MAG: D-aminoacyl-tRNA deacylase, partial [Nanoarchaeota archaeon]